MSPIVDVELRKFYSQPMSVQLNPAQEARLENLATQTALTPDQLLQDGLGRYLDHEEEMIRAVKQGDEDIAAGRLLEHDEVVARIERLLACG